MSTPRLIDPKQTVADAKKAGLIYFQPGKDDVMKAAKFTLPQDGPQTIYINCPPSVKFPAEAGIAAIPPPAKSPRRKPEPAQRKWLTKDEAVARGYPIP